MTRTKKMIRTRIRTRRSARIRREMRTGRTWVGVRRAGLLVNA